MATIPLSQAEKMNASDQLLTTDHVELDKLLAETFAAIENGDAVETYQKLDLFWARLAVHIRAEHLRLFPTILTLAKTGLRGSELPADISSMIDNLGRDHDFFMKELARAIKAMRLVFHFGNEAETFVVVKSLLEEVRKRLVQHNLTEEQFIYPLVDNKLLDDAAASELTKLVQREIENLPPRFR